MIRILKLLILMLIIDIRIRESSRRKGPKEGGRLDAFGLNFVSFSNFEVVYEVSSQNVLRSL